VARVLVGQLLPPRGSYDGFDVDRDGISWCQNHYSTTPVPFRFTHADLYHAVYNTAGTASASDFRFPYPDASFDLAIATSVFTHLLEDVADQYLAETARVLAPGGRLFATWFLVDPNHPPDPATAITSFSHSVGDALTSDPVAPESAVAYRVPWLRERLNAHGLRLRDPIHHGSWTGRGGRSSQDIIVADRPS
jgi:SAM-dependent methyltransferase